jgi:hypothetical protein
MRNLDDELKGVLRREEPPEGFAERVLRRVEGGAPAKTSFELVTARPTAARRPPSQVRWYQLAAAAAVILAIGGGTVEYRTVQRERAERAAGEAATAQVMLALEIAGAKLQLVQTKIHAIHDGQPKNPNR